DRVAYHHGRRCSAVGGVLQISGRLCLSCLDAIGAPADAFARAPVFAAPARLGQGVRGAWAGNLAGVGRTLYGCTSDTTRPIARIWVAGSHRDRHGKLSRYRGRDGRSAPALDR